MRNGKKSPKMPYSATVKKMESDPESTCRSGSINLISARESPLANACHVWSRSAIVIVNYPANRMTDRMTNHITWAALVE